MLSIAVSPIFVNCVNVEIMTDQASHNGHDSTTTVSKNSSKIRYLFAGKSLKKDLHGLDDDETNLLTRPHVGRFPIWLVVTAYVLVTLSILYTVWGLITSLNR